MRDIPDGYELVEDSGIPHGYEIATETLPTQSAGALESLGRGYLKGGKDVVMGALQTGTDIMANIFPESKGVASFRELLPEAQKRSQQQYEAQVGDSKAAKVGEFIGEAAPFVASVPAGATSMLGRIGIGAAGGALAGATAPTELQITPEQALEERAAQATTGGAIGAIIPAAIQSAPAIKKGAELAASKMFGINPQAAKDFLSEGMQNSLASISDRPSIQLVDRWLSKFVGGAGVIQKNTDKTLKNIQSIIQKGTTKAGTPQEAGEVIQKGAEKYVQRFNSTATRLYNRLDKYLAKDTPIQATNATKALQEELTGLTPNLSARKATNEGVGVLNDIVSDARQGLTYENLKTYRTLLGQKLSKPHLLNGEDEAVLSRAYAAITEDMKEAAAQKGEKAINAFNKANDFYKRGAENIKQNLQKVIAKDVPEQVYQAALSGSKLGGTKINSIMRSLTKSEKEIVRETVIYRLGMAKAGAQDAAGEVFSPQTFLTEWNKLSKEARAALFNRDTSESLSKIARINQRLSGIDRFANPSGTNQQLSMGALLATAFYEPATAAGAVIGANVSARLMTNQSFTNWLAKAATKSAAKPVTLANRIKELRKIAQNNPSISGDIAKYLGVVTALTTRNEQEAPKGQMPKQNQ